MCQERRARAPQRGLAWPPLLWAVSGFVKRDTKTRRLQKEFDASSQICYLLLGTAGLGKCSHQQPSHFCRQISITIGFGEWKPTSSPKSCFNLLPNWIGSMMLNFNEPTCAITAAHGGHPNANLDLFIAQDFQSRLQFSFIHTRLWPIESYFLLISLSLSSWHRSSPRLVEIKISAQHIKCWVCCETKLNLFIHKRRLITPKLVWSQSKGQRELHITAPIDFDQHPNTSMHYVISASTLLIIHTGSSKRQQHSGRAGGINHRAHIIKRATFTIHHLPIVFWLYNSMRIAINAAADRVTLLIMQTQCAQAEADAAAPI